MSEKSEHDKKIFQSYLDNIQAKTGKSPAEFRALAAEKGLSKHSEIVNWLKGEFGLGHGHANALVGVIMSSGGRPSTDDALDALFAGGKASWRPIFDKLVATINSFGSDVEVSSGKSYVNLTRGAKKFGIVQPTASRLDIGIKRKGVEPTGRFEASRNWNPMVTHRVQISEAEQVDEEVVEWLRNAYVAAT